MAKSISDTKKESLEKKHLNNYFSQHPLCIFSFADESNQLSTDVYLTSCSDNI